MKQTDLRTGKTRQQKRPGAGRPAACEVAGRLERLLDTATEVFLEQGYKNANMAEIANRAAASKATLYARYPTKASLFVAVIARKTRALQESFAEILVAGRPLKKAMEDFGGALLRAMARPDKRALYRVFVAESSDFPQLARKFWDMGPKRSMEMLRDYLRSHPEFKGKHPGHAAEMFWSLCCGQPILKAQLHKNYLIPQKAIDSNVQEAVRIFLAAYT
jgi:AcrR family transcriptional regulator